MPIASKILGALVARQARDAHLAHHLEKALVERVDVVVAALGVRVRELERVEGLEGKVRVDRARAVAHEEGQVGDLARLARLDDQARSHALAGARQGVVDGARRQEARDGRMVCVNSAIAEHDQAGPAVDGSLGGRAQAVEGGFERFAAGARIRGSRRERRTASGSTATENSAIGEREELGHLVVREDGLLELEQPALLGRLGQQVAFAAEAADERHHQLLADRVDRRVGHLRELLLEVAEQGLRAGC